VRRTMTPSQRFGMARPAPPSAIDSGAACPKPLGSSSTLRVLTDKIHIHLQSASIWTYTFFTTGFPRFLSIRGGRGLQAFDLPLLTNLPKP
jgi:hypothetical protein